MRVLYVASAIEVGGASGGWTHVTEVACGLSELGHDLLVIARKSPSEHHRSLGCGVPLRVTRWPQHLAFLTLPQVRRAVTRFKPDVVMERYYNFAGAGVYVAHRRGIPALLEVNAPMVDPPGSAKSRVDRLLLGSLRRWAVRQGEWSAAIVTPLSTTVPLEVPRRKIHELPWGANVERFDPAIRVSHRASLAALSVELGLEQGVPVAVFLGSFRAWHGAINFALAARRLLAEGVDMAFLAIGGGPELEKVQTLVRSWGIGPDRFAFAGPQPHERIPELLALADIGVAPFDLHAHAPLAAFGFYWSPLKVFEYMAMGLPVVTVDVTPLNEVVRDGQEGLLYPAGDGDALASRLKSLADGPDLRKRLGLNARVRVTARYSWRAHCTSLDHILRAITHGK